MHGPGDCPFCGGWGKTWHYTWDCRSAFTCFCWTCRGTGFLEDRLAELTRLGEEMGLESRVCLTHETINICRKGDREGGCEWSEDPADVTRIQAMHIRSARKP